MSKFFGRDFFGMAGNFRVETTRQGVIFRNVVILGHPNQYTSLQRAFGVGLLVLVDTLTHHSRTFPSLVPETSCLE